MLPAWSAHPHTRAQRMTASGFYIMAIAIAGAFFFIVWGVLNDFGAETPWITAGIGASIVLVGAVVVREGFIRRARRRAQRVHHAATHDVSGKLTLESNTRILDEIKRRSDAANVLGKLAAGHREVYELCGEYLARVDEELKNIHASSPRLEPILRGRKKVAKIHKYHMLRWAEIEATELTVRSQSVGDPARRLDAAEGALTTVNTALETYPAERALQESRDLLNEMVVSLNVSRMIAEADKFEAWGDPAGAIAHYHNALIYLQRDKIVTAERHAAVLRITQEIERLSQNQ